jgi:inhibitor of cysteine peptidase
MSAGAFTSGGGVSSAEKLPVYSDPSTPIKAQAGESFRIMLESNPTTGYSWKVTGGLDGGVLELVGSEFLPPRTQLKGAGGEEVWTIKAKGAGKAKLTLEYARPWEKDKPPVKKAVFAVEVR